MTSIDDLTTHLLQQEALDKLWLGKPVGFRWRNGSWHTGTVLVLHAKSRQAHILGDDGEEWHQPIEELQLLPEATPPPTTRWARWKQHMRGLRHKNTK